MNLVVKNELETRYPSLMSKGSGAMTGPMYLIMSDSKGYYVTRALDDYSHIDIPRSQVLACIQLVSNSTLNVNSLETKAELEETDDGP